jgi:subtilisin family serine protease
LPTGGSADAVVQGLAWLAEKRVPVINISLVGPPNRLVETVVRALTARGHIIVAAVGNSGPASPVEYPAAYDGVIGATSVDREGRIQIDANRGPQVTFAALGVDVPAAALKKGYSQVTGTSFAAPMIAARFAMLMLEPIPEAAAEASAELAREAVDLGEPGRDPVFGYGLLECPPGSRNVSFTAR